MSLAVLLAGDQQVGLAQPMLVLPVPCAAELSMLWSSLVLARLQAGAGGWYAPLSAATIPQGAAKLAPGPLPPSGIGAGAPWRLQVSIGGQLEVLPVMPEQVRVAGRGPSWGSLAQAWRCLLGRCERGALAHHADAVSMHAWGQALWCNIYPIACMSR